MLNLFTYVTHEYFGEKTEKCQSKLTLETALMRKKEH